MSGSISATTLAYAGLAASVAGAGVGAVGAIQSSEAASSAAKYNAQIAANNATIATQNAQYAGAAGVAQAEQAGLKTRAEVGSSMANEAASGVDVTKGSALDVRSSAQQLGELNAITIRSNAARTAYGYTTAAASDTAQSEMDKATAQNDITSGYLTSGTTALGGIGSAASNYAEFTSAGGGGGFNPISGSRS